MKWRAVLGAVAETNLQEVHDDEEQQQEGRCKEDTVQEESQDPCQGHLRRDPALQEEVEVVTQRPCEEEPEPHGGELGHPSRSRLPKPQVLTLPPRSPSALTTGLWS